MNKNNSLNKKVLIIHPGQFGYHTSTYYYCKYLRHQYTIDYLGLNENLPNKEILGVNFFHVKKKDSSIINRFSLIKMALGFSSKYHHDFILINYSPLCFIFRLFFPYSLAVEIRSVYIFKNKFRRILYNIFLSLEARLFKNITTISNGISNYLFLPKKTVIIPLGGEEEAIGSKTFDSLKMLYVGTFVNRNIQNTITAFSQFHFKFGSKIEMEYNIIGFGSNNDVEKIIETIKSEKVENHVSYLGIIRQPELSTHLQSHNVGISYIPLTPYYDFQPPTKTFEYLLSGMAVLGTHTSEHRSIINNTNGVLVGDTANEVYNGMVEIYKNRHLYSSHKIKEQSMLYTWEAIVEKKMRPFIESIN